MFKKQKWSQLNNEQPWVGRIALAQPGKQK